ncbi:hypothetical protein T4E_8534 [Trichinella pseudospiralis]|uniref:Uncharacterized protein n=1 Tax=Trichinella pseudospiralis TaxID=6337 RepID=A0A0V0Y4U1_TRIPS|nr:hypothetical protein T4E_8534 [Trichinella pseudospiralis]
MAGFTSPLCPYTEQCSGHGDDGCCFLYLPSNAHRIFLSVGAVISATPIFSSCLSYIFLIYSIFSPTVQSLMLISWLRVFCLIVNSNNWFVS